MKGFSQADLSPDPIDPQDVPLPYGLSGRDLRGVFGDDPRADEMTCRLRYRKQGLHGGANSCIVTLSVPRDAGMLEQTVFLKAAPPERSEWPAYQLLARGGVRTPRVLTVVQKPESEVLVLEFLPKIGIDFLDPDQVSQLLRLLARLNSLQAAEVPRPSQEGDAAFDRTVKSALDALADRTVITGAEAASWFQAYVRAQEVVGRMPTALTHGEFFFQQVGITADDGSVVVFDLATLDVRPRLFDIANILRPLADGTGMDERAVFARYVTELDVPGVDWQELLTVRVVSAMWALPWLVSRPDADLDVVADQLRRDLRS